MMSRNERVINGVLQIRKFAYLHKSDIYQFGLLEAADYKNARQYLGSRFRIRQVWLTVEEDHAQAFDKDRKWQIVAAVLLEGGAT